MTDTEIAPTRRLFVAIMLPPEIQESLAALTRLLDAHRAAVRPVRAEALHITLRFLGEQTAEQERQTAEACAAAVRGVAAFPLAFGGFGAFPTMRRPRVVWLGLRQGAEASTLLHDRLQDELRRRVVAQAESFSPHLTLARVRPDVSPAARVALGAAVGALPAGEQARCMADALSLVHSTLTPHGSRYDIVGRWPLRGQA